MKITAEMDVLELNGEPLSITDTTMLTVTSHPKESNLIVLKMTNGPSFAVYLDELAVALVAAQGRE